MHSTANPFSTPLGSGTTVGEAHKLGFTVLGRDINPVAVEGAKTSFGPIDRKELLDAFEELKCTIAPRIRALYKSRDSRNQPCEALYFFWVMQVNCPRCQSEVDLFRSYIVARNAFPNRKPQIQILCPTCGNLFQGTRGRECKCSNCETTFDPASGTVSGQFSSCLKCKNSFKILDSIKHRNERPAYRLYGKLVLTGDGNKEYLPASVADLNEFESASRYLCSEMDNGNIVLPDLKLERGYNTRQAMRYGFRLWRDFFNARQLLALKWLQHGIEQIHNSSARRTLLTLFSGALEFNNLFASYKGEGTGAVRHMFSHHILKPERMPIEANVWGTPKSSGSFSGLFRSRLLRALDYREYPTELHIQKKTRRVCSSPFSGQLEPSWPIENDYIPRGIYLSCGDSRNTELADRSIDFIVTDPPFFDNVHYSELADFFRAWHRTESNDHRVTTTRTGGEVQDTDASKFADKLQGVLGECKRVLVDNGLLVFTYHHSRPEGWSSLADAILGAGFRVVNAQPVRGEMSVAAPKSQAKEPIQLDVVIVCRKFESTADSSPPSVDDAIETAQNKITKLIREGFDLSRNDLRIIIIGQLLTTLNTPDQLDQLVDRVDLELAAINIESFDHKTDDAIQQLLF